MEKSWFKRTRQYKAVPISNEQSDNTYKPLSFVARYTLLSQRYKAIEGSSLKNILHASQINNPALLSIFCRLIILLYCRLIILPYYTAD